jgi:hypothetical protein
MLIYFKAIWNILQTFGLFYDHLIYFAFIWYIFPVLVSFTKKNLATLDSVTMGRSTVADLEHGDQEGQFKPPLMDGGPCD